MEDNYVQGVILLNRYQLIREIGKGGMALVYEGKDLMLERSVAVKLLRSDFSREVEFQNRFKQEARSAANLSHPGIVTIYDFGIDPQGIFIVMEYVPGKDLKTRLMERGAYSSDEGVPLMIQACAALGYAHRSGIIHCDVKPHNMLVTNDARLKITDFGIARALSTVNANERAEVVWGSPQYLSPEQAKGEPPSPASDVYSLGVVMYELFTGKLPFATDDPGELATLREESSPIPPHVINPAISPSLEAIILKVLSREPSARYRTADQLGRVLMTFGSQPVNLYAMPKLKDSSTPPENLQDMAPPNDQIEATGSNEINWKTIGYALLAVLLAGGLIPFWLYIWFTIKPLLGAS
jgi:serine/threonine-protein kinase